MIDITVDLETCSLAPTAAVISIAAVAWKRNDVSTPFFGENDDMLKFPEFSAHVDLRSEFLNGFTFDQSTADWWARQNDEAKAALLDNDSEDFPCQPIDVVVKDFMDWMEDTRVKLHEDEIYLWAQGTDFDVAILRNICHKMGLRFGIKHVNFRDHRTFYLEMARCFIENSGKKFTSDNAYAITDGGEADKAFFGTDKNAAHDPVYDCKRSILSTWKIMNMIKKVFDLTFSPTKKAEQT